MSLKTFLFFKAMSHIGRRCHWYLC